MYNIFDISFFCLENIFLFMKWLLYLKNKFMIVYPGEVFEVSLRKNSGIFLKVIMHFLEGFKDITLMYKKLL